ncbi:MAG: patatin-like phospholipase family protein, partial [candidate division Zixibacteria bacterium]
MIGGLDGVNPYDNEATYSVALAISGGGARGLSTIGILKAFEEKHIKIMAIAGTSMGAIIGGLYACGYSPDELSDIIGDIDFDEFFSNAPRRQTMFLTRRQENEKHLFSMRFDNFRPVIPRALTGGQTITTVLTKLTTKANYQSGGNFLKLPIPFRTVATDILTGREIILERGSLADAMRASMAFPLALTAVERNGQLLMDGGMVTPIPVNLVKKMCDNDNFVVAINTTGELLVKEKLRTPVDIANQVTTIMTADKLTSQLEQADLVLEPKLSDFDAGDFESIDSLINIGYRTGLKAADSIISILKREVDTATLFISDVSIADSTHQKLSELSNTLRGKKFTRRQLKNRLQQFVRDNSLFRLEAELFLKNNFEDTVALLVSTQEYLTTEQYKIEIKGNSIFDSALLISLFVDGRIKLNPANIRNGLKQIVDFYIRSGYDAAYVSALTIDEPGKVITIEIDEAIIYSIDIEDNRRSKDWLVRSYFPLKAGRPYSTRLAADGINNIYGTNFYEQVTVDLVPYRSGARVKIRVKERHYTQLKLGWHWHDEFQSEEFVEILDDNIRGMGLEYLLHAQYTDERQSYFARLKIDRIWFSYMTASITAYHNRLDRKLFDDDGNVAGSRREKRTGFELSLGQQLARLGTVRGAFVFEEVRNDYNNSLLNENFGQRIIHLESQIETFDRVPFPNNGKLNLIQVRLAGKFLGGEVEYTRFFSSLESYIPLGKYLNFHPKVSIGISRSGLPGSELFYLGGAHSFIGFRTNQLSGDKMILFNNEF